MGTIQALFYFCIHVLNMELNVFGHTFTLFNVFVVTIVLSIVGWVIGKIINMWGN